MEKFEVICRECESEYSILSAEGTQPEYCPYCSAYNLFDEDEEKSEEDEDDL